MREQVEDLYPPYEDRVENLVTSTEARDEAAPQHKTEIPDSRLLAYAEDYRKKGNTDLEAYFLYLADAGPKPAWCVR